MGQNFLFHLLHKPNVFTLKVEILSDIQSAKIWLKFEVFEMEASSFELLNRKNTGEKWRELWATK